MNARNLFHSPSTIEFQISPRTASAIKPTGKEQKEGKIRGKSSNRRKKTGREKKLYPFKNQARTLARGTGTEARVSRWYRARSNYSESQVHLRIRCRGPKWSNRLRSETGLAQCNREKGSSCTCDKPSDSPPVKHFGAIQTVILSMEAVHWERHACMVIRTVTSWSPRVPTLSRWTRVGFIVVLSADTGL